jgi:CSLREA domain-containing protein
LIAVAACVLFAGATEAAQAAISVNTVKDELIPGDGTCSLREAANAAAGITEPDCPGFASTGTTTIQVPAGTYHLTLGLALFIGSTNTDIAIAGAGPSKVTIDADGHDRAVEVEGTATIAGVTVTGGRAPQGPAGDPSVSNGQGGAGGDGGGIANLGTLTLSNVVVTGNRAGNGGAGAFGNNTLCTGGAGGLGGSGGGIWTPNRQLTLDHVVIADNRSGDGGAGGESVSTGAGCGGGAGGAGGDGGGLSSDGQLTIVDSTITGNSTGNGGEGGMGTDAAAGPGPGGVGGAGGRGGALANQGSLTTVSITGSTIASNQTGNGGQGGTGGTRAAGGTGLAGALGGTGGSGAGIYNQAASTSTTLINSTIAANTAGDGGSGGQGRDGNGSGNQGAMGGQGGTGGTGGGIYDFVGDMTLASVTLSANSAGGPGGPGPGGIPLNGGTAGPIGTPGTAGTAGSIFLDTTFHPSVTEGGTIVAAGTPENCIGPVSGFHDLSFPDTSCPHDLGGDPKLGPLSNYGGPTQTVALQPGSAAIDALTSTGAGCPATDQRGVARPQGGACDIGAYEFAPPVCRPVAAATRGTQPVTVQLSCADPAKLPVTYAIVRGPRHGKLGTVGAGGRVTYTAKAGFAGRDTFTYRASDANGSAVPQTATVSVAAIPLVISEAHMSKRTFAAGTVTLFQFRLSAAATVQVTITHRNSTRTLLSFRRSLKAGKDAIDWNGKIGQVAFAPGRYQATLVARSHGRQSRPVTLKFTIIP